MSGASAPATRALTRATGTARARTAGTAARAGLRRCLVAARRRAGRCGPPAGRRLIAGSLRGKGHRGASGAWGGDAPLSCPSDGADPGEAQPGVSFIVAPSRCASAVAAAAVRAIVSRGVAGERTGCCRAEGLQFPAAAPGRLCRMADRRCTRIRKQPSPPPLPALRWEDSPEGPPCSLLDQTRLPGEERRSAAPTRPALVEAIRRSRCGGAAARPRRGLRSGAGRRPAASTCEAAGCSPTPGPLPSTWPGRAAGPGRLPARRRTPADDGERPRPRSTRPRPAPGGRRGQRPMAGARSRTAGRAAPGGSYRHPDPLQHRRPGLRRRGHRASPWRSPRTGRAAAPALGGRDPAAVQGARLTAYEAARAGMPYTLLADNAAGSLFAAGEVDAVLVGADRIAADGSTANKVAPIRWRCWPGTTMCRSSWWRRSPPWIRPPRAGRRSRWSSGPRTKWPKYRRMPVLWERPAAGSPSLPGHPGLQPGVRRHTAGTGERGRHQRKA